LCLETNSRYKQALHSEGLFFLVFDNSLEYLRSTVREDIDKSGAQWQILNLDTRRGAVARK